MSTEATRPLPNPAEHDTALFWEGTRAHQLRYQTCEDCGAVVFHPRAHCTGCLGTRLATRIASGRGTVYSWSVIRLSRHPFFRTLVPYAVAWIDLEEGPRLLSNVVGVEDPGTDIHCGLPVEVTWEDHGALSIPLFRPSGPPRT